MYNINIDLSNTYDITINGKLYRGKKIGFGQQLLATKIHANLLKAQADNDGEAISIIIQDLYNTIFDGLVPVDGGVTIDEILETASTSAISKLTKYILEVVNGAEEQPKTE